MEDGSFITPVLVLFEASDESDRVLRGRKRDQDRLRVICLRKLGLWRRSINREAKPMS